MNPTKLIVAVAALLLTGCAPPDDSPAGVAKREEMMRFISGNPVPRDMPVQPPPQELPASAPDPVFYAKLTTDTPSSAIRKLAHEFRPVKGFRYDVEVSVTVVEDGQ